MANLLTNATSDTVGTGASHAGPATVFVRGTFDGANVSIQVSDDDSTYVKADNSVMANSTVRTPCAVAINGQGTYYIRCVLSGVGDNTSVSAVSTQ